MPLCWEAQSAALSVANLCAMPHVLRKHRPSARNRPCLARKF